MDTAPPSSTSADNIVTARPNDAWLNLAAHPIGWPISRLARRLGGVVRVPGFGVLVSDAEVAHDILMRDEEFTKNGPGSLSEIVTQVLGPFALINMDGEAHKRLRGTLTDILSPARSRVLLQGCEAPLASLRQRLTSGETVDLAAFMRELGGRVTLDMLGSAEPDERRGPVALELFALGERIAAALTFTPMSDARAAEVRADCDGLSAHALSGWNASEAGGVSLVGRLRELGLSFEEAKGVLTVFFLTGTLTTSNALPRIVALLVDSGQFAMLREHPELIGPALSEGLRYATPVPATMRIARDSAIIGGKRIARGARIIVLTSNLARDPRMFADPDRFDITRAPNPRARNLWYGAGVHFCLGFALAQRELQMVLESLVSVPGTLRIVRRKAARGVLLPSYARLEIAVERARR